MNHLLAMPLAAASSGGKGGTPIGFFVIIGIFAVVYLVFLRPMKAKRRAALTERSKAEVGDRVTTTAGLLATVVAIDDDEVILEIAPGVHCRYLPAAIGRVMADPEAVEAEPTDTESRDDAESHSAVVDEPTDT
jgi:preprotein translocase subunit YajC